MAKPTPWYKYPWNADYGTYPDPEGNYPKPDINIQCPDGTPITNLLPGTITGLNSSDGHIPAWGAAVTLRLDKPVNAVATHIAYLHLEPLPNYLMIGQHVPKGEVVGYSGGQSAQGSFKDAPVGIALYNGDIYGEGPSWDLYKGSAWLDPTSVLKGAGSNPSGSASVGETITSIAQHIRPDESVAELLHAMDVALFVTNPIVQALASQNTKVELGPSSFNLGPINIPNPAQIGVSIPDPFIFVGDVAEGLIQNFSAVFVRSLFIVFGMIVLYVVVQATMISRINQFLEPVGGISGAVEKGAALA